MEVSKLNIVDVIVIMSLILGFAALLYVVSSKAMRPKKNIFRFVIIGTEGNHHEDHEVDTSTSDKEIIFNGVTYKGHRERAFFEEHNFFDKQLSGIAKTYYMIFYEKLDKKQYDPVQVKAPDVTETIKQGSESFLVITSSLLYKVYKYKGAKKAYEKEFKEQAVFDFPIWAIMIAVMVIVALGVIAAEYMGFIDIVKGFGAAAAKGA